MRRLVRCLELFGFPGLAILGALVTLSSPARATEVMIREAQTELLKHVKLVESPGLFVQILDEVPSSGLLGELGNTFVKENNLHLDYLSKVGIALVDTAHPETFKPEAARERFERAKEQSVFLDLATELFASYLKSKGQDLSGWMPKAGPSLPWGDVKAVAVRFFMPVRIQDDGRIGTRICVTGEGMADYASRDFQLEGFLFNLKRACGAIWALFYGDAALDKILRDAYLRRKSYLPFVIAEGTS